MDTSTHNIGEIGDMPRPLAEHVAPELAAAAMKHYETRRNPEGLFHSAWNHAELALNKNIIYTDETRDYYFETSRQLLGDIFHDQKTHQDTKLGSLILSSYLPLLRKRAYDEEVDASDCDQLYESLGAALRYLQPLTTEEPPQWRMAEVGVLALSARTQQPRLLLYPTSPREERSSNQRLNHDSYFYDNGDKIPLQQKLLKTQKTYDEWITILTLQPLVDKGLRVSGGVPRQTLADKVNYLLSLIVSETNGVPLERHELKFLNFMGEAVVAHHAGVGSKTMQVAA